jgi:hypothetical protein
MIIIVSTKGTVVVVSVPVFGIASTVKFTVGFLALLDLYDN